MTHDPDKTGDDLSQEIQPQDSTANIAPSAPEAGPPQDGTVQLQPDASDQDKSEKTVDPDASQELSLADAARDSTVVTGAPQQKTPERFDGTIDVNDAPARDEKTENITPGRTHGAAANDQTGAWSDDSDRTGDLGDRTGAGGEESDRTGAWEGARTGAAAQDRDTEAIQRGKPGEAKKKPGKGELPKRVAGYEILGELGRGGMGVVYKARQTGLNRLVALKMVLAGAHASAEQLARFRIEGEAVAHLQHPNIVQVYEVGEEDGCPFFSLEFIDGDSLTKKIDGTPQPAIEAARLLQKLAEAMYVAHQRGIIHRDLKPANILLTKDGVPKITDFGLAKRFEDDKDEGHTRAGAIMGTPSYMAPEQAEGKTKDTGPPADIYSLGSILYDLLTGTPPFRGTTLLETLQAVRSMEPVPPKRLQPGVPKDLETICLKSLEKDPKKRYATAGDLAEDLRRFADGEPILARPTAWWERGIKWAKRRPATAALVGVSVLAAVSFLTLGGLWLDSERRAAEEREQQQAQLAESEREKAAVAQENERLAREREIEKAKQAEREKMLRQRAEDNFRRARDAVDSMLSQVGQVRLAHVPQMQEVRRELLAKALKLYQEFQKEKGDDPAIRREVGRAQYRVADIYKMLGQPKDASQSYENAVKTLGQLASEQPDNLDYREDLAGGLNNYGNLLREIRNNRQAEKTYREAMQLREELAKAAPQSPARQRELAEVQNNLGIVLRGLGKFADADKAFSAGLAIISKLAQADPKDLRLNEELARTLNNYGSLLKVMNRAADAEKNHLQAKARLDELVKTSPKVSEYRQQLAMTWNYLGHLWRDTRPKEAEDAYRQALALRSRLVKDFSTVPAYREELAQSHSGLAVLLQATGRAKEAAEAQEAALDIQATAVADFPHLPDLRAKLASNYNNRGIVLLTQQRLKDSEEALDKALGMFADLVKEFPDVPFYQEELAGTYLNLGTLCQVAGRLQQAEEFNVLALKVRDDLARRFPGSPEYQKELGSLYLNLATLQRMLKNDAEAGKSYARAIELFTALTDKHPDEPDYRRQLADSHGNLANLQRAQKKDGDAAKSLRAALALYEKLAQDFPEVPEYPLGLARQLNEMAILQAQTEGPEPADKSFRQGIAALEKRGSKKPLDPRYTRQLVELYKNLGSLLKALNKLAEEENCLLRAIELREELAKAYPDSVQYRQEASLAHSEAATRFLQNEKFAPARKHFQAGVDHLLAARKANPKEESTRQLLYASQLNLAFAAIQLGDYRATAEAIAAAEPLAPAKGVPHQVIASLLARCAGLAAKDDKLPAAEAKTLASNYAGQAMKSLQLAVSAGFRDVAFLEKTADFEPIRMRQDFQKLLASLRSKSKE